MDETAIQSINAFELMRIASMQIFFDQLRIDLCEWIKTNGGGWIGRDNANTIGKKFITDLSKSLWYIDNCSYKTLDDSPEVFTNFLIGLILKVTKKHEDFLILMNYKISIRS